MGEFELDHRRFTRVERLARVERLLFDHAGGLRALDISRQTGVDRRTIYRDVETLRQRGVPIWQEGGRFGIARDQYRPPVNLDSDAAMILLVGLQMLTGHVYEHGPLIAATLDKLAAAFPASLAAMLQQCSAIIARQPASDTSASVLQVIAQGWASLRMVRIWYRGDEPHDIAIYFVAPAGTGGVYLMGRDPQRDGVLAFRLAWVQRARLLDETYILPADFDPIQYQVGPWHLGGDEPAIEVVLCFSPAATPSLKGRLWHPSQVIEEFADGACRLSMHVSSLDEIHAWVLAWGASVEVVAPPTLRDDIAAEVRRMGSLYA
jgi:predicted DNA-binding transcriptional regulator YafY